MSRLRPTAIWRDMLGLSLNEEAPAAVSWLNFIGVTDRTTRFVLEPGRWDAGECTLWSFGAAVILAEHLPDEFAAWRALRRMGVT